MDRKHKIVKCKTCGTILDSEDRFKNIVSESEEALKKYYNKHIRRKNDTSKQSKG